MTKFRRPNSTVWVDSAYRIPRDKPPRKQNRKRRETNKQRAYGPSQRRAFVRGLPCSSCGIEGFSQNAHVVKIDGGMGFKGSYLGIAPLCGSRFQNPGCHNLYDEHRSDFDKRFPWYVPEVIAADTERKWVESCENGEGES